MTDSYRLSTVGFPRRYNPSVSGLPFERFWRRLDPRRSVAARLLLGFSLAFLLPATVFVVLIQRRLAAVEASSGEQVAAVRVAEASTRLTQDASFRAEWIESRTRTVEEAAWTLASAARVELASDAPADGTAALVSDGHGHLWTPSPEGESVALIPDGNPFPSDEARRDAARSRALATLMSDLLRRRSSVRSVRLWTASGSGAAQPVVRPGRGAAGSRGEAAAVSPGPGGRVSRRRLRPPETRPSGRARSWLRRRPRRRGWFTCSCPSAAPPGASVAGIALEIDARRYVAEAVESWEPTGDFWFALDAEGHTLLMTPRAAATLGWNGIGGARLADAASPDLKRLASRALRSRQSVDQYVLDGRRSRIATARVAGAGWVFCEGLSEQALDTIRGEAARVQPARDVRRAAARRAAAVLPAAAGGAGGHRHRVAAGVRAGLRARSRRRADRPRDGPSRSRASAPRTSSGGSPRPSTRWASASSGAWRRCAACTTSRARRIA